MARRQGRLLLVGRPGTGKTVASRLIAARWAGTPHAPVPLWLRLQDLEPHLPAAGPYRFEPLDLVRPAAGPSASHALLTALTRQLEDGHALLVLDGLDEVPHRRDAVVEALAGLLAQLPRHVDVLVTSRHSAQRAAAVLGLAEYELTEPHDLEDTLDLVLAALARREAKPPHDPEAWMAERKLRIDRYREENHSLWDVPLLATLMVVLIAEHPNAAMPASRAHLLADVVQSSVRRWEVRRPRAVIPSTGPDPTADVLLDCYPDIAHLIVQGQSDWDTVVAAVRARLREHWHRSPGSADGTARDVVEFWDGTAGIFLTSTPRGVLRTRTRLLAEIGEARWAVRDSSKVEEWVRRQVADETKHETLRLAAGLCPAAAHALIACALERPGFRLLALAHGAVAEGAVVEPSSLHALNDAQIDWLLTMPADEAASAWAELAVRLAESDLDQSQAHRLMSIVERLGREQASVIAALRTSRAAGLRSAAMTEAELDLMQEALVPFGGHSRSGKPRLAGAGPLVIAAVSHLLPHRPEAITAILAAARQAPLDTLPRLQAELPGLGHGDALWGMWKHLAAPLISVFKALGSLRDPFEMLADLPVEQPGSALTPRERWHLDDAAAFVQLFDLDGFPTGRAVEDHRKLTQLLCGLVLDSSGLTPSKVTAQLRSLRAEKPGHPEWVLLTTPSDRTPSIQVAPRPIDDQLLRAAFASGNEWLMRLAAQVAGQPTS